MTTESSSLSTPARTAWAYIRGLTLLMLAVPIMGYALSVAPLLIPDQVYVSQLRTAVNEGQLTPDNYGPTSSGMRVDQWSDCVLMGTNMAPGINALENAAASPSVGNCEALVERLEATEGIPEPRRNYVRYWFGPILIMRPLIAFFGIGTTRLLLFGLLAVSLMSIWRFTVRKAGTGTAVIALGGLLLSTMWWNHPEEMWLAISWSTILLAPVALAIILRKWRGPWHQQLALFGFLSGAVFGFMHFLINIYVAAAVTIMVAAITLHPDSRHHRNRRLASLALTATGWGVGFCWTWISKWLVAGLFLGLGTVLDDIREQAEFRLAGEWHNVDLAFGATTGRLFLQWLEQPGAALFIAVYGVLLASYLPHLRGTQAMIAALSLLFAPWIWFEVFANHSQIHAWLLWPNIPISMVVTVVIARLYLVEDSRTASPIVAGLLGRCRLQRFTEPATVAGTALGILVVLVALQIAGGLAGAEPVSDSRKTLFLVATGLYLVGALAVRFANRWWAPRWRHSPVAGIGSGILVVAGLVVMAAGIIPSVMFGAPLPAAAVAAVAVLAALAFVVGQASYLTGCRSPSGPRVPTGLAPPSHE